jgi:transposase
LQHGTFADITILKQADGLDAVLIQRYSINAVLKEKMMKRVKGLCLALYVLSAFNVNAEDSGYFSGVEQPTWMQNYPELQAEIQKRTAENQIRTNVQAQYGYQTQEQPQNSYSNNRMMPGFGQQGMPQGEMQPPQEMQELFAKYPELEAQMEALKDLDPEERMAAMQALQEQYPELQQMGPGRHGGPGAPMMGGNPMEELFSQYPELEAQMEALKELDPEERMAAMQALQEQYPELQQMGSGRHGGPGAPMMGGNPMEELFSQYPELEAQMEALKELAPEERMAAMQALQEQYPELQQMGPGGHGAPGAPGMNNEQMQELFTKYPELEAQMESMKDLEPEERMAAMQALEQQYPELQQMRPSEQGGGAPGAPGGSFPGQEGQSSGIQELFTQYPELQSQMESIRDLSGEERMSAMQSLEQQYPELQNMKPSRGQGMGRQGRQQGEYSGSDFSQRGGMSGSLGSSAMNTQYHIYRGSDTETGGVSYGMGYTGQ